MTLALAKVKSISISVDAVFTSDSISRNTIAAIINPPVKSMLICGVLKCLLTLERTGGSNWSLLIAIGDRDAASIPPFAVVTNAAIAARLRITKPAGPMNSLAAMEIGA